MIVTGRQATELPSDVAMEPLLFLITFYTGLMGDEVVQPDRWLNGSVDSIN